MVMEEIVSDNCQANVQSSYPGALLTERLEQLGYECLFDQCERFTTMRLTPIEIKRKEELITPLSE